MILWSPSTIIAAWCGQAVAGIMLGEDRRRRQRLPLDARQQAAAAHRRRDRGAHQIEQRRRHVDQLDLVVDHARGLPGDGDDERHAHLLVEEVGAVEVLLVLAPGLAVVGHTTMAVSLSRPSALTASNSFFTHRSAKAIS